MTWSLNVSTSKNKWNSPAECFLSYYSHHSPIFTSTLNVVLTAVHPIRRVPIYRIIPNDDCGGFNNFPPRSPDATPYDFFLWGYIKDQVYVPPLPATIPELKVRIRTANETITADMLQTVWNEIDYRVDVCRITKDAHTEHLYGM